jgi:hypothetical protein
MCEEGSFVVIFATSRSEEEAFERPIHFFIPDVSDSSWWAVDIFGDLMTTLVFRIGNVIVRSPLYLVVKIRERIWRSRKYLSWLFTIRSRVKLLEDRQYGLLSD